MKKQSFSSLLAAMLLFVAGNLFSQSAALAVQGVLTKSDGTAVDDAQYSVVFQLWTDASAGTKVHEETKNIQTVGGVYSALLGEGGFQNTATFNQVYYLGVVVGGTSLTPRPRLTHAPYTLAVIGQNNQFTSTGAVKADAYQANSGGPDGGTANKGYSFRGAGDNDGGLFSYADDQVSLYTNAVERIKVTSGLTEIKTSNTNAVNLAVSGSQTVGSNLTVNGNQTVNSLTVNGNQTVNNDLQVNHNISVTNALVSGTPPSGSGYGTGNNYLYGETHLVGKITNWTGGPIDFDRRIKMSNGGYTFSYNGFDDHDSGLFGAFDGEFALRSNGNNRILIGANGDTYIHNTPGLGSSNSNVARININSGLLFRETSSRRYKTNIRKFQDDFAKILQAQPYIYNRFDGPSKNDDELGYIAEELDSLGMKHMVVYRADGLPEGVQYDKMAIYAIEFLKIQQATIAKLQADVASLQAEKSGLTAENTALKKQQTQFGAQLEALAKRMNTLENSGATGMRK